MLLVVVLLAIAAPFSVSGHAYCSDLQPLVNENTPVANSDLLMTCEVPCLLMSNLEQSVVSYDCCKYGYRRFNGQLICTEDTPTQPDTEPTTTTDEPTTNEPTTTTDESLPRCGSEDYPRSRFPDSSGLCRVVCFTQKSYGGAPFGERKVRTRYHCCEGEAVKKYPKNIYNNDLICD